MCQGESPAPGDHKGLHPTSASLSLTPVRARQARTYLAQATTRVPIPTMTTARPHKWLGVIVRAGVVKRGGGDSCGCLGRWEAARPRWLTDFCERVRILPGRPQ